MIVTIDALGAKSVASRLGNGSFLRAVGSTRAKDRIEDAKETVT